jgi:hypothetical protein
MGNAIFQRSLVALCLALVPPARASDAAAQALLASITGQCVTSDYYTGIGTSGTSAQFTLCVGQYVNERDAIQGTTSAGTYARYVSYGQQYFSGGSLCYLGGSQTTIVSYRCSSQAGIYEAGVTVGSCNFELVAGFPGLCDGLGTFACGGPGCGRLADGIIAAIVVCSVVGGLILICCVSACFVAAAAPDRVPTWIPVPVWVRDRQGRLHRGTVEAPVVAMTPGGTEVVAMPTAAVYNEPMRV